MCALMDTIETMCDETNVQDKKHLLLARLVDGQFKDLKRKQDDITRKQDKMEAMLTQLVQKLDKEIDILNSSVKKLELQKKACPVFNNISEANKMIEFAKNPNSEKIIFFVKNPKLAVYASVGGAFILGMFSSGSIASAISYLLKLFIK